MLFFSWLLEIRKRPLEVPGRGHNDSQTFMFSGNIDHQWYHFNCVLWGLAKDHQTLRELKVTKGAKIMVVGSTLNDVLSVTAPTQQEMNETTKTSSSKEPLSQQKVCIAHTHTHTHTHSLIHWRTSFTFSLVFFSSRWPCMLKDLYIHTHTKPSI